MDPNIYSEMLGIGGQQPRSEFAGNGVFLGNNQAVLPPGLIADRLANGNFGPYPNNTAPPGYQVAPFSGQYNAPPQAPEPPQPVQQETQGDPLMLRMLALQAQAQGAPQGVNGYPDMNQLSNLGNPMDPAHVKNTMAMNNAFAEALSNRYGR